MKSLERIDNLLIANGFRPEPHPHYRGFKRARVGDFIAVWGPIGMMLQEADDIDKPTKQFRTQSEFIQAISNIVKGPNNGKQAKPEQGRRP